ncbi:hypothetical protein ACFWZ2_20495 [Streptomyces sp. NPDC059002]|uniref:hypothetical protein n=1 Tax=Streptomyces sp. NPDC059002 TaxID=3346690 RepID=UPI003690598D
MSAGAGVRPRSLPRQLVRGGHDATYVGTYCQGRDDTYEGSPKKPGDLHLTRCGRRTVR